MRRFIAIPILALLAAFQLGCESRTDKTDGGGVLLSISDFGEVPIGASIAAVRGPAIAGVPCFGGYICISDVQVDSVLKDQTAASSDLQTVEINSFEVTYSRADRGTRVPPPIVKRIFGNVPPGGNFVLSRLDLIEPHQLDLQSLRDMLFENGGVDKETGETFILLNCTIRFFGRGFSGEEVISNAASLTIRIDA